MDVTNEAGTWIPLYIMTSDKNDEQTRAFFEEHNYFGYNKDYVKFFVQEMVPAVDFEGNVQPTQEQIDDVNYGYWLAKETGKLDIGQSVVIKDKMIMAVEAIEGTDNCIKRGCKIAKKHSRVIKVAKPSQDKRFDIPAIGLKTIKTMKKYKADLIAVEAGETIIVDREEVIKYANKHNIVIMAV